MIAFNRPSQLIMNDKESAGTENESSIPILTIFHVALSIWGAIHFYYKFGILASIVAALIGMLGIFGTLAYGLYFMYLGGILG